MHTYGEKTFWYAAEHKTETTMKNYDVWQINFINKTHGNLGKYIARKN